MRSLDAAYAELVSASEKSAIDGHYQSTTSLAPELGLRELTRQRNQRGFERHDGGRALLILWRLSGAKDDRSNPQKHVLSVIMLNEGAVERRHSVEFEV